jgi:hypothetical protein
MGRPEKEGEKKPTANRGRYRLTVRDVQRDFQTQTKVGKFRFDPHNTAPVGVLNKSLRALSAAANG